MSSFTQPLILEKTTGRKWKVSRSFTYYIGEENSKDFVTVPKDFESDLASIPRFFWRISPPDGNYSQSSVLHDYVYFKNLFPRKKCDDIFEESMKVLGVPKWKRWLMYKAVRAFGGAGYNRAGKLLTK